MATVPSIARPKTRTQPDIIHAVVMDKSYAGKVGKAQTVKHVSSSLSLSFNITGMIKFLEVFNIVSSVT